MKRGLIVLFISLVVAACARSSQLGPELTAKYNAVFQDAHMTPGVQAKWARSCALCHVAGQGGAPRVGHADEWTARLANGKALLLEHTLDGFNKMPPLGYCMDCEMSDFAAMIDMMSGTPR